MILDGVNGPIKKLLERREYTSIVEIATEILELPIATSAKLGGRMILRLTMPMEKWR